MAKNKVEDVRAASSSLLRVFDEESDFKTNSNEIDKQDDQLPSVEVEKPKKAESIKTEKVVKDKDAKTLKRPFNLYLSDYDIKYLQDLGKAVGINPTNIVKSWIDDHRKKKEKQVQEALQRVEDAKKLL